MNYDRRSNVEGTAAPTESSISERLVHFAVATNELIDKIQEELDREDARIAWSELPPDADGQ
jgi:hypothetical protein